jgi:ribosome-interacting GTPase 1
MLIYEDVQIQLIDTPPLTDDSPPWFFHIIRTADSSVWIIDTSSDDLLENTELCIKKLRESNLYYDSEVKDFIKPMLVVANKSDELNALFGLEIVKEMIGELPLIQVSVNDKTGLEELKQKIFETLGVIRVYTKPQGKQPDLTDPVIIKKGSTVLDAAKTLHKEFAANLKYARLWDNKEHNGQMVERNYVLKDRDIIEFHV